MDSKEHFSVILFLTSKLDCHDVLPLIFNANLAMSY